LLGWGLRPWYLATEYATRDGDLVVRFLALDLFLLAALWLRLARLRSNRQSVQADERMPWLGTLLAGPKTELPGGWSKAGLWQRARHRRLIGLGHRFVWIMAVYLGVLISLSPLMEPYYVTWFKGNGFTFCALFAAMSTSTLAIGLLWPQRFAALADVELLRPSGREDFARELGLAMLSDAVEISLVTLFMMLAPIAIWIPGALASGSFWVAAGAAVLSQVLVFGAIVWTMRSRWLVLPIGAMVVTLLAAIALLGAALDGRQFFPAAVAAAVGIGLTVHAYRRWRKVDVL
jgi:hypothetical protein